MKYFAVAEQRHFFPFVFYETDKKSMYVYCPNCRSEHTIDIKETVPRFEKEKVKWIKENHSPCSCFMNRRQPLYLHDRGEHSDARTEYDVGEFQKNLDGSVSFIVYRQTASFAASQYPYSFGNPFYRNPVFDEDRTIEFRFQEGQKTKVKTCLYYPFMGRRICVGDEWHDAKSWHQTFVFDMIEDSVNELKGTFLEQYVADMQLFTEKLSAVVNIEQYMCDVNIMFLMLMSENAAAKKLWRAGYYQLVINKVFEKMTPKVHWYTPSFNLNGGSYEPKSSYRFIAWGQKSLEKILKVSPQQLDLISERAYLTISELEAVQKLTALGLSFNPLNVGIATSWRFEDLYCLTVRENSIPVTKLFKYLRHEINKNKNSSINEIIHDYYDYLKMLKKLYIPLTTDVVFPTSLKIAHDRAAEELKLMTDKKKSEIFKKSIVAFKNFNFEDGEYKIFVVDTLKTLQTEAKKLHNCSASYADRIIDGTSVIFLIRQKETPNKPFYMLELNPQNLRIVQNRGLHNCSATEAVQKFAELWRQTVVLPQASILSSARKIAV